MDGSKHKFTIEGQDEAASVKVYIDNSEYYSCTVNFTRNPATVSNERYANRYTPGTSSGGTAAVLPDVTGMTLSQARGALAARGFTNIDVKYTQVNDASRNGVVLSQSPEGTNTNSIVDRITSSISTDTKIVLTVGQMEGV